MRVLLALVAALLVASPALCEQQPPPPDVAIPEMVQQYVRAFNAGDADAAAATYTPTGSHTYAMGFTHHGRTEIAQGLKEMFAGPLKGARISIRTLRITPLAPTVAVEEEAFSLSGLKSPDGQPLPEVQGLCLVTHQYLDQQWLAAAVQCLVPPANAGTK
jgi:uncharacterized protein (TIGR02246 family)